MKKEELKDGVFYKLLESCKINSIILYDKENFDCGNLMGYWGGEWRDGDLGLLPNWVEREATLEELNALGDEHLPYSKYLQEEKGTTNPIYTLKDLSEGRVAVINDSTPEELWKVLQVAFPHDKTISYKEFIEDFEDDKYFKSDDTSPEWIVDHVKNLPTQSVKVFLQELDKVSSEGVFDAEKIEDEPKTFKFEDGKLETQDKELIDFLSELSEQSKQMREFATGATELWDGLPVTNDNGLKYIKRDGVRVFETGSVRSLNDGRDRYDLIPQLALDVAARIFGKNIGQFGSGNHLEFCIPEKACIESLKRHLADYTRYLEGYQEENEDDAGSILTNAMMLVHTIEMKKLGLYKVKYGS